MIPPLRIGFVGAGGIVVQRHLPGLRLQEGVEIVAVANTSLASANAFCAKHAPEAEPMENWRDIVAREDIDIVWIGTPPYLHKTATLAALSAGKHVFCQARMAMDLAEAREMAVAAEARPDLVTMLCPPPHGLAGDLFMKKLLAERVVGEIRTVRLQSLQGGFLDPAKPAHWRQKRAISGLNILTLGIHTEVLQRWLGDFTVTAAQGKIYVAERAGEKVDVPDTLQVLTRSAGGTLGLLEFSGVQPGPPVDQLKIVGSSGTLRYDFLHDKISQLHAGAEEWQTLPIPDKLPWTVETDFIRAVRDPEAPRPHPDFQDGLRYMSVVQQVADLLILA